MMQCAYDVILVLRNSQSVSPRFLYSQSGNDTRREKRRGGEGEGEEEEEEEEYEEVDVVA